MTEVKATARKAPVKAAVPSAPRHPKLMDAVLYVEGDKVLPGLVTDIPADDLVNLVAFDDEEARCHFRRAVPRRVAGTPAAVYWRFATEPASDA